MFDFKLVQNKSDVPKLDIDKDLEICMESVNELVGMNKDLLDCYYTSETCDNNMILSESSLNLGDNISTMLDKHMTMIINISGTVKEILNRYKHEFFDKVNENLAVSRINLQGYNTHKYIGLSKVLGTFNIPNNILIDELAKKKIEDLIDMADSEYLYNENNNTNGNNNKTKRILRNLTDEDNLSLLSFSNYLKGELRPMVDTDIVEMKLQLQDLDYSVIIDKMVMKFITYVNTYVDKLNKIDKETRTLPTVMNNQDAINYYRYINEVKIMFVKQVIDYFKILAITIDACKDKYDEYLMTLKALSNGTGGDTNEE